MATIREAFEYASQNPDSDFARNLAQLAASGSLDVEARRNGIDLTAFKQTTSPAPSTRPSQPESSIQPEKVLQFTGGDTIGKGLGQTLAQGYIQKNLDETMRVDSEQQRRIIEAIRQNRAEGKDTLRLENALNALTGSIVQTGNAAADLYNPNQITGKQIAGDALQLATTVVGAGQLPGVAKNVVTQPTILTGARIGATTGAAYGISSGAAQGLKQDKDFEGIATEALTGGVVGGVTGGILGGVSGGLKGRALQKQTAYLDSITPKVEDLTPTEYEQFLRAGKISPKTATEPAKYILSDSEKAIADKYKTLISTKDPVKNSISVMDEIANQDGAVKEYLTNNNTKFEKDTLKTYLLGKMQDVTDITIPETQLNKAKNNLVTNFLKRISEPDQLNLWQARKQFDQEIEKAFSGSPTLQKTMKRELRNAVQDFISENTDNVTYKRRMLNMRELYSLQEILETKATKERKYSMVAKWLKDNPKKATAAKWIIAGAGATKAYDLVNQ